MKQKLQIIVERTFYDYFIALHKRYGNHQRWTDEQAVSAFKSIFFLHLKDSCKKHHHLRCNIVCLNQHTGHFNFSWPTSLTCIGDTLTPQEIDVAFSNKKLREEAFTKAELYYNNNYTEYIADPLSNSFLESIKNISFKL